MARPWVVQLSESEEKKEVQILVEQADERSPQGTEVKMGDIFGKSGMNYSGLFTRGVRNCVVFVACKGAGVIDPIFMLHTPFPGDIAGPASSIRDSWEGKMTSYIIGGNGETPDLDQFGNAWNDLNITKIQVPLTQVGQYADIEFKGGKISYWVKDD